MSKWLCPFRCSLYLNIDLRIEIHESIEPVYTKPFCHLRTSSNVLGRGCWDSHEAPQWQGACCGWDSSWNCKDFRHCRAVLVFSVAWRTETGPVEWQTKMEITLQLQGYQAVWESLIQGAGTEAKVNCRTSDSGGRMWILPYPWNSGLAFYHYRSAGGVMGVCLPCVHVFCGLGKGLHVP